MLRKVFILLFLIVFSVNGNLIGDDTNSCPIASDDGNILDEGGITNGNVLSNDIDSDGELEIMALPVIIQMSIIIIWCRLHMEHMQMDLHL